MDDTNSFKPNADEALALYQLYQRVVQHVALGGDQARALCPDAKPTLQQEPTITYGVLDGIRGRLGGNYGVFTKRDLIATIEYDLTKGDKWIADALKKRAGEDVPADGSGS